MKACLHLQSGDASKSSLPGLGLEEASLPLRLGGGCPGCGGVLAAEAGAGVAAKPHPGERRSSWSNSLRRRIQILATGEAQAWTTLSQCPSGSLRVTQTPLGSSSYPTLPWRYERSTKRPAMAPAWPALQSQDTPSFPHQTTSLSPNGTTQSRNSGWASSARSWAPSPHQVCSASGIVCPCTLPSSPFSTGARIQDLSYMLGKSPTTELHPHPVLLSFFPVFSLFSVLGLSTTPTVSGVPFALHSRVAPWVLKYLDRSFL